jgi:hypothetical protein
MLMRPRTIDLDGRRYLWRDLLALNRAQATQKAEQPALFELREVAGRRGSEAPLSVTRRRACSHFSTHNERKTTP